MTSSQVHDGFCFDIQTIRKLRDDYIIPWIAAR